MKNSKTLVEEGYDTLGEKYEDTYSANPHSFVALGILEVFLKPPSSIIDVGSGTGVPAGKYLAEKGFKYTGIDISQRMLDISKKNVPTGIFVKANMLNLNNNVGVHDGAIALFSLLHIPKLQFVDALKSIRSVLKPEGLLLFCVNEGDFEGNSTLLDVPMFFSSFKQEELDRFVVQSGFEIVLKYFGDFHLSDETEHHLFYLVRKH